MGTWLRTGIVVSVLLAMATPAALAGSHPFNASFTAQHDSTAAVQQIDYRVPRALHFNGRRFRTCSVSVIEAKGDAGCPSGSKLGVGSGRLRIGAQTESLTIRYFNANKGEQILASIHGTYPVNIETVVKGDIQSGPPPYGHTVRFRFPAAFQQPVTGVWASLQRIVVKLNASTKYSDGEHRRTIRYVTRTGCPDSGELAFSSRFLFAPASVPEGEPGEVTASWSVACSPSET
jgi:hypothetical protein